MTETPRVEAFIRAKQDQVLARAIEALDVASPESVRSEVHRLLGTLGTYALAEAVDVLRPLDARLTSDAVDEMEADAIRQAARDGLRAVKSARAGGAS